MPAAIFLLLPATVVAQQTPTDAVIAEVSRRGRLLYEYERAAWHGTDAVLATWPNPSGVEGFLARKDPVGTWQVLFGRLSSRDDTLLVAAIATQTARADSFRVTIFETPQPGDDSDRRAFRAMRTAGAHLAASPRPFDGIYNPYVLPGTGGGWLVYFLPAQTRADAIPHGGDFRYEISADGGMVESRFQMHNTVIPGKLPDNAFAGTHTVVVADLPQESDVFLVLSRSPRKREIVVTDRYFFEIAVDGTITWRRSTDRDQ